MCKHTLVLLLFILAPHPSGSIAGNRNTRRNTPSLSSSLAPGNTNKPSTPSGKAYSKTATAPVLFSHTSTMPSCCRISAYMTKLSPCSKNITAIAKRGLYQRPQRPWTRPLYQHQERRRAQRTLIYGTFCRSVFRRRRRSGPRWTYLGLRSLPAGGGRQTRCAIRNRAT